MISISQTAPPMRLQREAATSEAEASASPRETAGAASRRRRPRPAPAPAPALPRGWLDAAALAEGGLLADVGVVLDLAAIYLPLVGTVLEPAIPAPFAILMLRRGPK